MADIQCLISPYMVARKCIDLLYIALFSGTWFCVLPSGLGGPLYAYGNSGIYHSWVIDLHNPALHVLEALRLNNGHCTHTEAAPRPGDSGGWAHI